VQRIEESAFAESDLRIIQVPASVESRSEIEESSEKQIFG
jgi:hypothetical protein